MRLVRARDAPADGPLKAFLTDFVDGRRRGLRARRGVLVGEGNVPVRLLALHLVSALRTSAGLRQMSFHSG